MTFGRRSWVMILTTLFIIALVPAALLLGSVHISPMDVVYTLCGNAPSPVAEFIIHESRLPAMLTALLAGAALSVAGLLMQTCFNNPLAGPTIMGISSGSGLGVALLIMLAGNLVGIWGTMATVGAAFAGAMAVLVILLLFSGFMKSADALLIVGILVGYLAGSIISLLNFFSADKAVHSFVVWGLGNFESVDLKTMPVFAILCILLIVFSILYSKSLNAMLFGAAYAVGVGVRLQRVRTGILLIAGGLTATITAWCGPIGFIGLVVPHIARMLLRSSNHTILIPATALCGAAVGILCRVLSVLPASGTASTMPINAITPIIGVPIIVYILLNRRKLLYF